MDGFEVYVADENNFRIQKFGPDNQAPVADAGVAQTVECAGQTGTQVMLNGADSSDPDGDALTYAWAEGGTPLGTGEALDVDLGLGTHTITLTVTDPAGLADSAHVLVTIED